MNIENLKLPLILFGTISFLCSLLDSFVFTAGTVGLLTIVPWGITAFIGLIAVVGGLYNYFTKK